MATYRIPYESLDPLTIGASGDEDKVNRDELELEIPDGNVLAAIGGRSAPAKAIRKWVGPGKVMVAPGGSVIDQDPPKKSCLR